MTEKYSHIHAIWKADNDAIRFDMIRRGLNPDAKPPGKIIKPYALQDGNGFRLPTINMVDTHMRCWWWNSNQNYWRFEFRLIIGTTSLDDDYIIDKPVGFDTDSQSWRYFKDDALKLISKGITYFIPYNVDCPPLLFCNPLDFENIS